MLRVPPEFLALLTAEEREQGLAQIESLDQATLERLYEVLAAIPHSFLVGAVASILAAEALATGQDPIELACRWANLAEQVEDMIGAD